MKSLHTLGEKIKSACKYLSTQTIQGAHRKCLRCGMCIRNQPCPHLKKDK